MMSCEDCRGVQCPIYDYVTMSNFLIAVDIRESEVRSHAMALYPCCDDHCLLTGRDVHVAAKLMQSCIDELAGMSRVEKKNYLRYKLPIININFD